MLTRRYKWLAFCKQSPVPATQHTRLCPETKLRESHAKQDQTDSCSSIQELILSGLYIYETVRLLRTSLQHNARTFMYQLFIINIIIIAMDIALLGVEFANLYIVETILKGVIYSIKLKLEFVVLGKLVQFVTGSPNSIDEGSPEQPSAALRKNSAALPRKYSKDVVTSEFVDRGNVVQDFTYATSPISGRKGSRPHLSDDELSLAMFEHVESATLQHDSAQVEANSSQRTRTNSLGATTDSDIS